MLLLLSSVLLVQLNELLNVLSIDRVGRFQGLVDIVIIATNCGFAHLIKEVLYIAIKGIIKIHERILEAVVIGK